MAHIHISKMSRLARPRACRTCLMSHVGDAEAADKAEGSCYMPHMMSQRSQKQKDKSGTMLLFSVLWKNSGKQSTEGAVKYSTAQLESGRFNISITKGHEGPLPGRGFWLSWALSKGRG